MDAGIWGGGSSSSSPPSNHQHRHTWTIVSESLFVLGASISYDSPHLNEEDNVEV
jgi:hypothetical protein